MRSRQELAARRAALLARSELQRREASAALDGIARGLWPIDAVDGLARRVVAHPLWVVGIAVALVVVVRPGRLLRVAAWGVSAAVAARRVASPWLALQTKRPAVL